MAFTPVYFHTSTDVIGCTDTPSTLNSIARLARYVGFNFAHSETNVTQGNSSTRHQMWGIALDEPLGGSEDRGGGVDIARLWNGFSTQVVPRLLRSNARKPLFSVVDHNSAHHMAYVLCKYAVDSLPTNAANRAMLITFDEHTDQQTGFSDGKIKCSNYVRSLLTPPHKVVDTVLHIGWDYPTGSGNLHGTNVFTQGTVTRVARKSDGIRPSQVRVNGRENYINDLRTVIEANNIQYVYVSVDRDFMQGSYTRYGDGESHPDTARLAVKDCLETIREMNRQIVGMDITGMPNVGGRSNALQSRKIQFPSLITSNRMPPVPALGLTDVVQQAAVALAFQDVRFYWEALNDALLI